VLAVADAAARIRLALRNPLDNATLCPQELSLASLFRRRWTAGEPSGAERAGVSRAPSPVIPVAAHHAERNPQPESNPTVSLWVLVAAVHRDGIEAINAQLVTPSRPGLLQVLAFRPGSDAEAAARSLEDRHLIEIVSTTRLTAGLNRVVSVQATTTEGLPKSSGGEGDCRIQVRFSPFAAANGKLRLRVSPEVAIPDGHGIVMRRAETDADLTDGQSFLVSGLTGTSDPASLLDRLFAGREPPHASHMELLVLVTPRVAEPVRTAVLR
ncbi:MAG: hypothetical protein ACRD9L_16585, partial [Bryobacteraceae bacterium]